MTREELRVVWRRAFGVAEYLVREVAAVPPAAIVRWTEVAREFRRT